MTDTPTMPSRPIVATSTRLPSSSTVRIEQKPAAGKQDIGLPRLSGYNMARLIPEQNGHNGRPVLVAGAPKERALTRTWSSR
jgi:hypothetical protein